MRALPVIIAAGLGTAMCAEFTTRPARGVMITAVAWPPELHVTDVDTVEIDVQLDDATPVAGLRIRWGTTNPLVIQVAPLQPAAGASPEDSLVLQRRAVIRGIHGGTDSVIAMVEGNRTLRDQRFAGVITVTQKWKGVTAGDLHSCGVTVDSLAFCWGVGANGALGNSRPVSSTIPIRVTNPSQAPFLSLAAGDSGTCALSADNVGYCWGSGLAGRLGNNDATESRQYSPVLIFGGASLDSISGGALVNCGIALNKDVFCWGDDFTAQLGSTGALSVCSNNHFCVRQPRRVAPPAGAASFQAASVDVGGRHVCAIATSASGAFCWGDSTNGALGAGTTTLSFVPFPVVNGSGFITVSAGGEHTCAMSAGGIASCWGQGNQGQLGNNSSAPSSTPVAVSGGLTFQAISAGGQHTCGLTLTAVAYCWGVGVDGQLGTGNFSAVRVPTAVQDTLRFRALSAGAFHTCGISINGSMYCWGSGLATGSATTVTRPTRISEP